MPVHSKHVGQHRHLSRLVDIAREEAVAAHVGGKYVPPSRWRFSPTKQCFFVWRSMRVSNLVPKKGMGYFLREAYLIE